MLSFKYIEKERPRAICIVKGGKSNGKIIYFYSDVKHIPKDQQREDFSTHIEIHDGMLSHIPNTNPDNRDIFVIAGGSGLGKSTMSGAIMEVYRAIYPDRPIYIFSKVKQDKSIDDLKITNIKRIMIDDSFLDDEPLDCNDFKKSLVLFDDIDTFNGQLLKEVLLLRDDLAQTARHSETTMIITTHLLMNYKVTKTLLLEGTNFTVFPKANTYQMQRFCRVYLGMSTEAIRNVLRLPSRHVSFIKTYPPLVMTQNEIMLQSNLDPDFKKDDEYEDEDEIMKMKRTAKISKSKKKN